MASEEEIYLVNGTGEAFTTREAAEQQGGLEGIDAITLKRPDLRPIYGGPTLTEALWAEMDRLMEALMTGQTKDDSCSIKGYHGVPAPYDDHQAPCEHWDNGDRYRAEELAWVLAITTNPYRPSVDSIRAEAMRRWKEREDQEDAATRPEGADQ